MVRALLMKDLMLLRYRILFGLVLAVFALMPMRPSAPRGMFGAMMTHMIVTAFLTQLGGIEERSRGDVLVSLLPLGRGDVVRARYLLLGGLAAAMATFYVVPPAILSLVAPAPLSAGTLATWWLWCTTLTVALWSVSLPVVFRWGMTGSQILINALMFAPFAVSMIVSRLFGVQIQSVVQSGWLATAWTALGALGLALALAYLSSLLSTRLYTRRDL
jgi:ABC-2 family transporter